MKTSFATLGLAVMLASSGASAQVPVVGGPTDTAAQVKATVDAIKAQYGSGTEYAAAQATRDLLTLLYDVPAEQINVKVVQMQGQSATVKATMPTRECDVSLMKKADLNKYGWEPGIHSCRAVGH